MNVDDAVHPEALSAVTKMAKELTLFAGKYTLAWSEHPLASVFTPAQRTALAVNRAFLTNALTLRTPGVAFEDDHDGDYAIWATVDGETVEIGTVDIQQVREVVGGVYVPVKFSPAALR